MLILLFYVRTVFCQEATRRGADADATATSAPAADATNPCPSDDCWTFADNTCTLNNAAKCSTLTCDATTMTVDMTEGVFGIENTITSTSPKMEATTSGLSITCDLGGTDDCDLTHVVESVDNGGDILVFTLDISQSGNERRLRTLDEDFTENKRITLSNGLTVITTPHGVALRFICKYPMLFTIESGEYQVHEVQIAGEQEAVGNLADGFTLGVLSQLFGNGKVLLGGMLDVTATWRLQFQDIVWHFKRCAVVHGGTEINVINESCASEALGAENFKESANEISFTFRSFAVEGYSSGEGYEPQKLSCDLELCFNKCADRTADDEDCPNTEENFGFVYVVPPINE